MNFELPALPYTHTALEPYISKETIEYHYGKHHKAYVDNLNKLLTGTELSTRNLNLEGIIKNSNGPIFNNAAQVWNHTFYWNCLTPNAKNTPEGILLDAIKNAFDSFNNFQEKMTAATIGLFGSGWSWLVLKNNKLEIVTTSNANTPLTDNVKPLLTCDVWEHAYYIDYRNARAKYLDAFWKIVNWEFVLNNLTA